jgi:hypothetical protein
VPHSGPTGVPQYASGPATQPQSISGATTQPTFAPPEQSPFAAAQPQPFAPTGHGPAAPPPPGPAQPQSPFAAAQPEPLFTQHASGGIPEARLLESESSPIEKIAETVGEIPNRFLNFLKLSSRRAFRLRIEPTEVLPDEKLLLEQANPPVLDQNLQAFLSWRRSVVFLVATILTLLSITGLIDSLSGGSNVATPVKMVKLLPTLAETAFCLICWLVVKNWTDWRKHRKWLLYGWLLFMLVPFAVFLYPLRDTYIEAGKHLSIAQLRQQFEELGVHGLYTRAMAPFVFGMIAMLQLAPKVISLMPGLIRSSMVVKLLFPGTSAPGWLIVMCAPLYALIAYAILVIPYQITGEGWFMFGVVLVTAAQVLVMRSGFALAKPMNERDALHQIRRIRKVYIILLIIAAVAIIYGLGLLVKLLSLKWTSIITTILKFESNVMILTTIGTDLVVTNLDRARGYTEGKEQIEMETEQKIAAFVGLNAPKSPPPPGPAQY